ncbi:MAG: hypothetical protein KOO66_09820 [Bacteroidales bacterium]|nr:hypothetical protein [Bacteroidales bacterium]
MVKNKYSILPFLLLAWTIIFAHSVIPHHHSENFHSECSHHSHETHFSEMSEIHDCNHECNDHTCHFHVDVLTKVSVDNVFITNNINTFLNNLNFSESYDNGFFVDFISNQIPKTNHLRGPPVLV